MNPQASQPQDGQRAKPGGAGEQVAEGHAEPGLGAPGYAPRDPSAPPVGWYSRLYLPHYNNPHTLQSVTFRLADSLPQSKLQQLERELLDVAPEKCDTARRKQIEAWLDAGMGCCALKHPALAALMQETLLKFDGDRYRLIAWCIMPNHVHVLVETIEALSKIVQSWKSFVGRWALARNAELGLGVPGRALWMREYWDRYIRDGDHFDNVLHYIERNPVAAGLCAKPNDWPWSSASARNSASGNAASGNAEPQLGANEEIHAKLGLGAPGDAASGNAEPQLGANDKKHAKLGLGAPSQSTTEVTP
ncbi:MAG: transposase [Verrucomicrobia bacterium]|nr:transposase [Verrucomicrobiota bacterium]